MLQIVSKMYFRDGVPLHTTIHRRALYSNIEFLTRDVVTLPIGELAASTGATPVTTMMLSVTEHVEAEELDGSRNMHIATGGEELVDAVADVLSFGLNATFSRDRDLVARLVPDTLDRAPRVKAANLFRGTFDPARYVPEFELDECRRFMGKVVTLRRTEFEAVMRAIRRIVGATRRAIDDPTMAYVDLVARWSR